MNNQTLTNFGMTLGFGNREGRMEVMTFAGLHHIACFSQTLTPLFIIKRNASCN